MKTDKSRRGFLRKAALGSLAAISIPEIISAAMPQETSGIKLLKSRTILFQGDSITDAGRSRKATGHNNAGALGSGYAMLAAARLLLSHAPLDLKIYNRGISGNKVYQLAERWDEDCIDMKPDVVSILIGVNDIWHKLDGNYDGTVGIYRRDYIALLERTRKALPDVKLIIGEPFGVRGVRAVGDNWYPEFYEYQKVAREIALQFDAQFIPYQAVFDEAQLRAPAAYWTGDGVHASLAGAALMAEAWLRVVE